MAWLLGFGWFLYLAAGEHSPPRPLDGIVALTGGPERVETALQLLAAGAAARLLISGTGEKTDLAELARHAGIDPAPLQRRITIGRAAHSTHGNALETQIWARENKISSLLAVTAWFHMPRALAELRRSMPEVAIHPFPVGRIALADLGRWAVMRRMIGEYHKYVATLAGITAWPFGGFAREPAR